MCKACYEFPKGKKIKGKGKLASDCNCHVINGCLVGMGIKIGETVDEFLDRTRNTDEEVWEFKQGGAFGWCQCATSKPKTLGKFGEHLVDVRKWIKLYGND